jgi:ubiquitin-conjugating enzyme E2 A
MASARRRLMTDLKNLRKEHPDGLDASPEANSILKWRGTVRGPPGTPWEGQDLEVSLEFPDSYPLDPPKVMFLKKICHPNVYPDGTVCVDILKHNWSPSNDVLSILISLQAFLAAPNFRSIANPEALLIFVFNPRDPNLLPALMKGYIEWSCENMTDEEWEADLEECDAFIDDPEGYYRSRLAMLQQCFESGSPVPPSCRDILFVSNLMSLGILPCSRGEEKP